MRPPYQRISCEEAFLTPAILDAARKHANGKPSMSSGPIAGPFIEPLLDLGEGRIALMDKDGVDVQLLMLTAPGVQIFDPAEGAALARDANDVLAATIKKYPARFAGLAAVAPQAPEAAAAELQRAVNTLGLKGALINSHTNGDYLDHPKYFPVLEAAAALGVPIYIHPRDPAPGLAEGLRIPGFSVGWGFGVETGTHALRLIAAGIFDRLPGLTIILGHMGETIPFVLDRIDNRYLWETRNFPVTKFRRLPSEYFRTNFRVTTSGMNYWPPLQATINAIGIDNVIFAADYPYEDQGESVRAMNAMPLPESDLRKIFETNPRRVFKL